MSTVLLTQAIWPELTKAARGTLRPCTAAVAYFGSGASKFLPLPKGSLLVVDASDRAVASGQTCPADLLKLVKRGVAVYSVPNLHAKVFVLGRTAYVGSTNVSNRSASQLIEAVLRTTEPRAVQAARRFVEDLCLHELTPEVLKQLANLYRPTLVAGGNRRQRSNAESATRPTLPRLFLAQLHIGEWSDRDQVLHDAGLVVARKRRLHPRTFELTSFRVAGRCPYQRGDVVIQVTDEGAGKVLVSPPANVLHVRRRQDAKGHVAFVYLEHASQRRRDVGKLANQFGRGSLRQLRRDGQVRDKAFAQSLLGLWAA
jgi:PLD-like domain